MKTAGALIIVACALIGAAWGVQSSHTATRRDAGKAAAVRELSNYISRAQEQRIEALRAENALLRAHGDTAEATRLRRRVDELTGQIEEAVSHGCTAVSDVFCAWPK